LGSLKWHVEEARKVDTKKKEQKIVFDFFIPYIQSLSVVS